MNRCTSRSIFVILFISELSICNERKASVLSLSTLFLWDTYHSHCPLLRMFAAPEDVLNTLLQAYPHQRGQGNQSQRKQNMSTMCLKCCNFACEFPWSYAPQLTKGQLPNIPPGQVKPLGRLKLPVLMKSNHLQISYQWLPTKWLWSQCH